MYQLSILENPNGTFSFVGRVPYDLAYETKDGAPMSPEEIENELRLPSSYRTMKCRVFKTYQDAMNEAQKLGHTVPKGA